MWWWSKVFLLVFSLYVIFSGVLDDVSGQLRRFLMLAAHIVAFITAISILLGKVSRAVGAQSSNDTDTN